MSYTNDLKPSAEITYLLMEDGGYLLQEDGSKIVLSYGVNYLNDAKGSGSYSNDAKGV